MCREVMSISQTLLITVFRRACIMQFNNFKNLQHIKDRCKMCQSVCDGLLVYAGVENIKANFLSSTDTTKSKVTFVDIKKMISGCSYGYSASASRHCQCRPYIYKHLFQKPKISMLYCSLDMFVPHNNNTQEGKRSTAFIASFPCRQRSLSGCPLPAASVA
jgi:hypothetical protein